MLLDKWNGHNLEPWEHVYNIIIMFLKSTFWQHFSEDFLSTHQVSNYKYNSSGLVY
jgi:hypothetical protein